MKLKYLIFVLALGLSQAIAYAETLSGTVTAVDSSGQKVTLRRADTNGTVTIYVKDRNALTNLEAGNQATFEANRRMWGGWETQALSASPSIGASVSTGLDSPLVNSNNSANSSISTSNPNATAASYSTSGNTSSMNSSSAQ